MKDGVEMIELKHINNLRTRLKENDDWGVYDGVMSREDIINLLEEISELENAFKEVTK